MLVFDGIMLENVIFARLYRGGRNQCFQKIQKKGTQVEQNGNS